MTSEEPAPFLLLALPDACLLAVLQCCAADDQRSLFSAARAHSRLHPAAVAAQHSVTAAVTSQQQLDNTLQYVDQHSHHIHCIDLISSYDDGWSDEPVFLCLLPASLQVTSLQLNGFILQLNGCILQIPPGNPFQGTAAAAAEALQQLQLDEFELLDDTVAEGLAANVPQLQPGDASHGTAAAAEGLQQLQLNEHQLLNDGTAEGLAAAVPQLQPGDADEGMSGAAAAAEGLQQLQLDEFELLDDTVAEGLAANVPQLQPGDASHGTAAAAEGLQQLQLNKFELLDDTAAEGLAAAVPQLQPGDAIQGMPGAAAAAEGLQQLQLNEYDPHADGTGEGQAATAPQLQPGPIFQGVPDAVASVAGACAAAKALRQLRLNVYERLAAGAADVPAATEPQLQPGSTGVQCVPGAAMLPQPLQQLRLRDCELLDSSAFEALAAALQQLPSLEHLSLRKLVVEGQPVVFPMAAFKSQQLQRLTYLELAEIELQGPEDDLSSEASLALQPLQALTRLVDLRLQLFDERGDDRVTAGVLSGIQDLTRLELSFCNVEPSVLAGRIQLQHLKLANCNVRSCDAAWVAQLLLHLQPLQQLTHLNLTYSLQAVEGANPPAAAYAALTASSLLQHLEVKWCMMPLGVWPHIFPADRPLPNLRYLDLAWVREPSRAYAPAPEGRGLFSCCPGLQYVDVRELKCSAELLAMLQEMRGQHGLCSALW